jgi:hypothetical protein
LIVGSFEAPALLYHRIEHRFVGENPAAPSVDIDALTPNLPEIVL